MLRADVTNYSAHRRPQKLGFISVWIVLLPIPAIPTHFFNTILSLPSKFLIRLRWVTITSSNVTRSTWFDYIWNFNVVHFFKSLHNIKNRISMARSNIINGKTAVFLNCAKRSNMCTRKIHNMDKVANSGSIMSRIVVPKDPQFLTETHRCLGNVWHQIIRDSLGIFTNFSTLMRTNGIKITQQNNIPKIVRAIQIHQHFFKHRDYSGAAEPPVRRSESH